MTKKVRAIIVRADGDVERLVLPDTLETWQGIVGGHIEAVFLGKGYGHAYINEDGKRLGLPPNLVLTSIAGAHLFPGDYIAGDAVILGEDDEGGEADVPRATEATVEWTLTYLRAVGEV